MFVHNINPVLLSLGPLEIRYYGLVYLLGALIIFYVLRKYSSELSLTKDDIYDLTLYLMLGVVIGSRLFEIIFYEPGYYFRNPFQMIAIWNGGMSFHGGLAGIVLAACLYCKKKNIGLLKLADILSIPAAFVLALGRIANYINGELVGTVANLSWCVDFSKNPNIFPVEGCRHPYQIYEFLERLAIGLLLIPIFIKRNSKQFKDGFIFFSFVLLFGIGRFLIDFVKEESKFIGLGMGQYLSIIMIVVSLYYLKKHYSYDIKKLFGKSS